MFNNAPIGFRHERQKKAAQRRWLIYAVVLFVALLMLRTPLSGAMSSLLSGIARPFWAGEDSALAWMKETAQLFSDKRSLIRENVRLSETLDLAALEAYSRELLRVENKKLKAALGRAENRELLLARVLATPGHSPYDTLILDIGNTHGLEEGMPVLIDGDFVIGAIGRVTAKSAIVVLASSYGNELSVTIGTSSLPAIAKGEGGGNLRITLPRGVLISAGDLVQIPAFASQYAGVVDAIERREGGSLQDLYVRVPFNLYELAWVYVDISEQWKEE